MNVLDVLEGREVCVCAGPGGVGKTTTAAAIAVEMAARGMRVAVLTIDPARRLAQSLGLPELGNDERRVENARLEAHGVEMEGQLWAMMLDAKRTFDELIERHAPDERTRQAVLSNRIYQELSSAVAGSQEYMAMEKLHELHSQGRYDLLVLDTPPSRNALDFLDAPERLSKFIDSRSLQFFTAPSRRGLKVFGKGTGLLFSVLKRITGVDLLQDLADFFNSFGGMTEGFRDRARSVRRLLGDDRTTFLVVTSPQQDSIDEAVFFQRRLHEWAMPFGAAIVNRVHEVPTTRGDPTDELAGLLDEKLAPRVAHNLEDFAALARRDDQNIERLRHELGPRGDRLIRVPHLEDDVHDVSGLLRVNEYLFPPR